VSNNLTFDISREHNNVTFYTYNIIGLRNRYRRGHPHGNDVVSLHYYTTRSVAFIDHSAVVLFAITQYFIYHIRLRYRKRDVG